MNFANSIMEYIILVWLIIELVFILFITREVRYFDKIAKKLGIDRKKLEEDN